MNKWYSEDWHFKIKVLKVGKENKAEECRLGLEPDDTFLCDYETPTGFCPTSFIKIFPVMEVMRCEVNCVIWAPVQRMRWNLSARMV
jgi:hypothetical protein